MSERWHGTSGGYSNHGCRCADCKTAYAAEARRQRANRVRRQREGFTDFTHGADGYQNWGCRCEICRTTRNARERARTRKAS